MTEKELVLIVEDNDKNMKLARDLLQFAGLRTLEATSAEDGRRYRAVFANDAGTAATSAATLSVTPGVQPGPVGAPAPPAPGPPAASFAWFPAIPHPGEAVALISSATDAFSAITGFAWDLAGGGPFVPGGALLSTTFATPGRHLVRLRVSDANGLSSTVGETIPVTPRPPALMQPFPVVRLAGSYFAAGARLSLALRRP